MVIRILDRNVEHTNNGKLKLEGYVVSVVDLKLSKTCQDSELSPLRHCRIRDNCDIAATTIYLERGLCLD